MGKNILAALRRIGIIFPILFLIATPAFAALYSPGQTLDPACAPTDVNCGVLSSVSPGIASSIPYYAADGSMLSATSSLMVLQNGTISIAKLTLGTPLAISSGGLGTSTAPGANQLLMADSNGKWEYVSTSTLGIIGSGGGGGVFSTTTSNSWSGLQVFNAAASTTQLTSTGATYLATLGGNVGIGTATPTGNLSIFGTTGENLFQIASSTNSGILTVNQNGYLGLNTGSVAPITRFEVVGGVSTLLGYDTTTANATTLFSKAPLVSLVGDGTVNDNPNIGMLQLNIGGTNVSQAASELYLGASRALTAATHAAVGTGDVLGRIGFFGDDGTNVRTRGAVIEGDVNSTTQATSTGVVPAQLSLATSFNSPIAFFTNIGVQTSGFTNLINSVRMIITGAGNVGIATSTPASKLAVSGGATVGADYNVAAPTNGFLVEGNVGIGTTTPSSANLSVQGNTYTSGNDYVGSTLTAGLVSEYKTYDAFGDSITQGNAASTGAKKYVSLLATALNIPSTVDHGVGGAQAADQADWVYTVAPASTTAQLYTLMVGTNDSTYYQYDVNKTTNYNAFLEASLAYLAIPNTNKVLGQGSNVTYTGTWAPSTNYGGAISEVSTTNGSTATFSAYGPVVYLAYTMQDSNGGQFSVSVDGTTIGTYNAQGSGGAAISTHLGQTYGSALLRIPNLSNSNHTVVITVTSATSASNSVWFDWAAGSVGNNYSGGPTVVAGGIPRNLYPGNVSSDTLTQTYTGFVRADVAQLAGDGLNVTYADVPSYINTSTDIYTDFLHPNDSGHAHIKDAFLYAIDSGSKASTKEGGIFANALAALLKIPTTATTTATSTFASAFSVLGNFNVGGTSGINFSIGTSTFNSSGGINLTSGCYAVNGNCITGGTGTSQWNTVSNGINYAGGNVGIGTSTPFSLLSMVGSGGTAPLLYISTSTTSTSTALVVTSAGYVGIGVANPTKSLMVAGNGVGSAIIGDIYGSGNWTGISLNGSTNPTNFNFLSRPAVSGAMNLIINRPTAAAITFAENNVTQMTLSSGGNFGIGTTSPFSTLSLQASSTLKIPVFTIGSTTPNGYTTLFSVSQSGDVTINGSSGSTCTIGNGSGGTSCTSDERLKTNITEIPDALSKIEQLRGVTFNWADPTKDQSQFIGVIAQDVQSVFPQAVATTSAGYLSVDYASLVAPLIEAVKEIATTLDGYKESFTTKKLCLEDTCITKAQLQKLLDESNQQAASAPGGTGEQGTTTDSSESTTTEAVTADPGSDSDATTTPDTGSDSTPAPDSTDSSASSPVVDTPPATPDNGATTSSS